MPALPRPKGPALAPLLLLTLVLSACEVVAPPATPAAEAPTTAAPTTAAPAAPATPPAAVAPAAPATPAATGAVLTREGVQTVALDVVNGTSGIIVELNVVVNGQNGPNLLPIGMGIPPGGNFPLPVAVGRYLIRGELQAPSVFTPAQQVLRHVIVPRFPPNPTPRMTVTLR